MWQSADPAFANYLPFEEKDSISKLPAEGGIYNSFNSGVYTYGRQNPVRYKDPDGNSFIVGAIIGGVADTAFQMGMNHLEGKPLMEGTGQAFVEGAVMGALGVGLAKTAVKAVKLAKAVKRARNIKRIRAARRAKSLVSKTRKTPGRDGGISKIIKEKDAAGKTISRQHQVTKDGKIVHQHKEHIGKAGSERRFPDSWTGTETINAPPHQPKLPQYPKGAD